MLLIKTLKTYLPKFYDRMYFLLFTLLFFSYSDPKHSEWAHTFIGALIELQQYCKEFHPMGVSWAS